jgi:pimeloyl-ACP methyl ester carboxylesterase
MATFVILHGGFGGGYAFRKVRRLLQAAGHEVFTPTFTGMGERGHLATPDVDLETHIADILGLLFCEDLTDVVLVGYSYGGMVATAVADRAPERIALLAYLDGLVPRSGESQADLNLFAARDVAKTRATGDGWRVMPAPIAPDVLPAEAAWRRARQRPQPIRTFEQPVTLETDPTRLPRCYIYCTRKGADDYCLPFAVQARAAGSGWRYFEIDSGHSPHATQPGEVADLLGLIAQTSGL